MQKCLIVHGCPGSEESSMRLGEVTYDKHWIPWIRKELTDRWMDAQVALMPEPWKPDYQKFKEVFDRYTIDNDSVLIWHSCGCAFLVRWLWDTKKKISKLILVAPWKVPYREDGSDIDFYFYAIDPMIQDFVWEVTIFVADDEEDDGKKSVEIFHEVLGGRVIELSWRGHYTMWDMGTDAFPELLDLVLQ